MNKDGMRILMLAEYFYPFDRGGSERSIYHLSKSLIRSGFKISVLTPNYGSRRYQMLDGIRIVRFPFYKHLKSKHEQVTPFYHSNLIWWIISIFFTILEVFYFKPTHIHIQGKYFLPAGFIAGKLLSMPTLLTLRDYIILCPLAYCIRQNRKYIRCRLSELVSKDVKDYRSANSQMLGSLAHLVQIAVSIRGWFVSRLLYQCSKWINVRIAISHKVAHIYNANGISVNEIIYNTTPFVKELAQKGKYFLFAGRLTFGKGADLAVEAYKSLTVPDSPPLLVLGEGPLRKKLMLENTSNIHFGGFVTTEKIQQAYRWAHLVIMPSRWEEPFGRVALEALSYGTPVIVSDRGALPEIVENGVTGVVVKPNKHEIAQAMERVFREENQFRGRINTAYTRLKHEFETVPILRYETVYKKLYET